MTVEAMRRPQQRAPGTFVLDVHLGTLARRLRLAGVDAAYCQGPSHDCRGRRDPAISEILTC